MNRKGEVVGHGTSRMTQVSPHEIPPVDTSEAQLGRLGRTSPPPAPRGPRVDEKYGPRRLFPGDESPVPGQSHV